ncbi:hypothetical protein [Jannaschia ovalis]|uniref:Uncharacterized protein n=1 Tax=Jannaschia ovalis TaxID=3038773 RepID=A0ABY8LAT5_9RHOB|nr:hypothetical protein [Jannaschia sp. GRR-S6-38]WGH78394.1 hypothetical protein P8627_15425 [Jannaschia sp. GRR-S6-38]
MILINLIVGILAGLAVPRAEKVLKDWAESIWLGDMPISDHEFDLAALLVILMLAAVVCAILGVDSSAFMLAFGALVGLFGKRLWTRIQRGEP